MASSGSNTYTHSSGMYIRLEWRIVDTNIANNRTKISYDVYIGYQYRMSSSATKNANITVDGVSTNFTFTIGNYTSGWEKHLVVANEKWISHNTDGTKSTSLSAWADVQVSAGGYYVNRLSVSLTANLDPIPRTSTMTGSSSVNAGGTYSYTVSPASSSFSHTLTFSIGSKTSTVTAANGAGTWTVPASWAGALPTKTSGVMNVVLTTKNGTTTVGTRSYTTTLLVPSSMVPSVGSLSIAKHSSTPSPANGSSWPYVQNITTAYASVSGASGSYGSTISSYTIKAGGTTRYASSGTFPLPSAGNITFTATVKDSRGRTASKTSTLTVVAYSPPRITGVTLTRTNSSGVADNAGTYAKVVPTFTKTSIMNGTTQLNNYNTTGTIVRYRKVGSSTWTSGGTVTSGATRIFGGGTLSPDASYEVEVIVKDQLSTATWGGQIGTEFVTLDLLESGTGIAVGKVATEANTFDSALKMRASNGFTSVETIYGLAGLDIADDSMFRGKIHAPSGYHGQRLPSGANLNNYTTPGVWYESSNAGVAGMSNTPPTNYAGSLVVLPASMVIQYWHDYSTGSVSRVWRRRLSGSTWSSWEHYAGSVVGGSAANGYIMLPGGIQICWYNAAVTQAINASYGGMFIGNHTWSFGRNFSTAPVVSVGTFQWGSGASWGTCYAVDTSQAQLRGFDPISRAAGSTTIRATAIGYGA